MIILYPITCLDHTEETEILKINIQNIEYLGPDPDDDNRSNVKMIGNDEWYQISNEEAEQLEQFIYDIGAPKVLITQHDFSLTEDMVQGSNYPNYLAEATLRSSNKIKKAFAKFGAAAVKSAISVTKAEEGIKKQVEHLEEYTGK